jgi:predicted metal-dependent enzyme (double-stranded beta helix superfamily)
MGHTLEQLAAKMHDILAAEPGPAGREKVRALVQEVLTDEAFVAKHLGDDVPERKILFEDPQLGFCILAHVYKGARESNPHDHGPTWAIYGQARGETLMNDWALVEPASEKMTNVTEPHTSAKTTWGSRRRSSEWGGT